MKRIQFFSVVILLCAFTQAAFAQDDFDFGGEALADEPSVDSPASFFENLSLRGALYFDTSVETESFRWIRLGPALHAILDFPNDVISIYGEATARLNGAYAIENDPQDVIEGYTFEAILRELYVQKGFENFTLTLGNKMVVWSEADILPVMDLISVSDLTESLFANPEEARLGQNIIGADLFLEQIELNFVFSPWPAYGRFTSSDHPYSLAPGVKINEPSLEREVEAALRVAGVFDKVTFSFAGGRVSNRVPLFSLASDLSSLDPLYEPFYFAGFGSTLAFDPFLWKFEARYAFDKPFQNYTPIVDGFYLEDELAFTLGADLNLGDAGFIIVEGSMSLPESDFTQIENAIWMAAAGWSISAFQEQVSFSLFAIAAESIENIILRAALDWFMSDDLSLSVQYTGIWMGGGGEYGALADQDRAGILIKYHFNLGR